MLCSVVSVCLPKWLCMPTYVVQHYRLYAACTYHITSLTTPRLVHMRPKSPKRDMEILWRPLELAAFRSVNIQKTPSSIAFRQQSYATNARPRSTDFSLCTFVVCTRDVSGYTNRLISGHHTVVMATDFLSQFVFGNDEPCTVYRFVSGRVSLTQTV